MFGLGVQELMIIFLIIIVLFGAKKLPELAGGLGKGIKEFKKATREAEKDEEPKKIDEAEETDK